MNNFKKKVFAALLAVSVLSTSSGGIAIAEEGTGSDIGSEVLLEEAEAPQESQDTMPDEVKDEDVVPAEDAAKVQEDGKEIEETAPEAGAETESQLEEIIPTFSMDAALFDDISSSDWFHPFVSWVFSKSVMTGKGDNKFAPGEILDRAQFATVLYRVAGSPEVAYNPKFPDTSNGQFYSSAVSWATQEEIKVITGYEDGRFGPNDSISREQMATMLYRYYIYIGFDKIEPADLGKFPDGDNVSAFAVEAMKWAVGAKIISGDQGKLNPFGETNRAVCATMITRFCEKFMPDQLPDIDLSATCEKIEVEPDNINIGTFRVKIYGMKSTNQIAKVQVPVYCNSMEDDGYWYTAEQQGDGTYTFVGDPSNHKYHSGTYTIDVYALLNNGVRLYTASQTTEVSAAEIPSRVYRLREGVYNEVGRDLWACYRFSVMPYYAQGNYVPDAYTQSQWYSIYGIENRRGDCYVMAATFYQLAIGLGYQARFVQGYVPLAGGGMGEHGWVEIDMDGTTYVFDPDFESETGRNGYQIYYGMSGTWRYSNYTYVD